MISDAIGMFFFGNPEDSARMYWNEVKGVTGPALPEIPLDEQTEQELRVSITYQRMAIKKAWHDGASDEILGVLLEEYDNTFAHLAAVSESFRDDVEKGRHRVIGGYTRENLDKYRRLAGLEVIFYKQETKEDKNGATIQTTISHSAN
ncbi:hypothetical protein S-CBS2_gp022 [Synechococcus phage S-CBS2]|uniref:hypothetical protein n=1 Tax=Synechococcus phage S-CBS2 TaxID=753084 RepID=UPI00020783EF|nr:hypothetical protein S-CBS2_gp022 [Synechococcus phage S-CBS2]ADF42378.1 hypothetical protein S-CBS2_gp022 [Synechococcus phage S-CBS2]